MEKEMGNKKIETDGEKEMGNKKVKKEKAKKTSVWYTIVYANKKYIKANELSEPRRMVLLSKREIENALKYARGCCLMLMSDYRPNQETMTFRAGKGIIGYSCYGDNGEYRELQLLHPSEKGLERLAKELKLPILK